MRKPSLCKITEKNYLDQSIDLEEDYDNEDYVMDREGSIMGSIRSMLSENKDTELHKCNTAIENIVQFPFHKNTLNRNNSINNTSIVSLDVKNINRVFLRRYNIKFYDHEFSKFKSIINKITNLVPYKNNNDNLDYSKNSQTKLDQLSYNSNEDSKNQNKFESCEKSFNSKLSENYANIKNNSNNLFTLPKRKNENRIFEEFISIGIDNTGLETITDYDELYMNPKILFNYPNRLQENELNYNIKFLKNFCFNEGVKVKNYVLSKEDDFEKFCRDKNFFANYNSSFCLIQQITPEDIEKYFIFGIKFDDFYIKDTIQKSKSKVIFVYEKIYLFIANKPSCKLFDTIFQHILRIKKQNYSRAITKFYSLFSNINSFERENNETTSDQIAEILQFSYQKNYPRPDEYLGFCSNANKIVLNYYHPNKYNEEFLAINWLSKIFFKLIDSQSLYTILTKILLEQSIIFICDNIENLTSLVLGFSYLISPFKWPYIIVPNLPLDLISMVESPVPFLIGILDDTNLKSKLLNNNNVSADIAIYKNNNFEMISKQSLNCNEPHLKNLKQIVNNNLSMAHYYLNTKKLEEFEKYCETIYKNIYETLKYELAEFIVTQVRENSGDYYSGHLTSYNTPELSPISISYYNNDLDNHIKNSSDYIGTTKINFIQCLDERDRSFGHFFCQTQIFQSYWEEVMIKDGS